MTDFRHVLTEYNSANESFVQAFVALFVLLVHVTFGCHSVGEIIIIVFA